MLWFINNSTNDENLFKDFNFDNPSNTSKKYVQLKYLTLFANLFLYLKAFIIILKEKILFV